MGLMDTIFGSDEEDGGPDIADEFEPDEEPDEDLFDDDPVEQEEEELEWETAYKFAEDMLEADGFANMGEFTRKAMMHKINRSPLYRDRIEHGVETMNMVTDSIGRINELQGSRQADADYSEFVDEVKAARELSEELDKLDGKEDQIINEVIGIANDAVGVMQQRTQQQAAPVETGVEQTEEEI